MDKVKTDLIRKIRCCETHEQLDQCISEFEEWKESITPGFWGSLLEGPMVQFGRRLEISEVESSIKIMDGFISIKKKMVF